MNSEIDLDTISAQSLRLVRSILTLIALLSVIVLWSEIHSAFGFLENITLWNVSSTVQWGGKRASNHPWCGVDSDSGADHHHAAGAKFPGPAGTGSCFSIWI